MSIKLHEVYEEGQDVGNCDGFLIEHPWGVLWVGRSKVISVYNGDPMECKGSRWGSLNEYFNNYPDEYVKLHTESGQLNSIEEAVNYIANLMLLEDTLD